MEQTTSLRHIIESGQTVWAAGVYDALSAKIAETAGFSAVMTSGFAVSASYLGLPDVELYTMSENLNVIHNVANAVTIPVIADADTGYGNAINVMRTTREFEKAGAAAMIFEDQEAPKRCPAVADAVAMIERGGDSEGEGKCEEPGEGGKGKLDESLLAAIDQLGGEQREELIRKLLGVRRGGGD